MHFYCLVLHKRMSSFSDLSKTIVDEDGFKIRLLSFLDQVISCERTPVDTNQVLSELGLLISTINDASVFALQIQDNANLITSQVQIEF